MYISSSYLSSFLWMAEMVARMAGREASYRRNTIQEWRRSSAVFGKCCVRTWLGRWPRLPPMVPGSLRLGVGLWIVSSIYMTFDFDNTPCFDTILKSWADSLITNIFSHVFSCGGRRECWTNLWKASSVGSSKEGKCIRDTIDVKLLVDKFMCVANADEVASWVFIIHIQCLRFVLNWVGYMWHYWMFRCVLRNSM